MKKNLYFVASLMLAASLYSCSSEDNELLKSEGFSVTAGIGTHSRTTLLDDGKTVVWSEGDQIYLFGGNSNATMTLVSGEGQTNGTFNGPVNGFPSELTYALYPVPQVNGGTYTYELSSEITYSENSGAPMAGRLNGSNISFNNLVSLVRLPLMNLDTSKDNQVKLTLEGQKITGKLSVSFDEDGNVVTEFEEDADDTANEVIVTIPAGTANCDVDFPIPAGTYTGYKVELNDVVLTEGTIAAEDQEVDENSAVIIDLDKSEAPEEPTEGNPYEIKNVSQLIWLAEQVNGGNTFAGKTITLIEDINLSGIAWTPIGNDTNKFKGTFDGQDHTISNLYINGEGKSNQGLFGYTTGGEIKNLVVENAKVTGRLHVGVVAGTPYTSKYTNITVKGLVQVEGMSYVGGVGGYSAYASWTDVTVDAEEGSYVKANSVEGGVAYRTYVGGVVGFNGEGGHSFTNISSNIDVTGSTCDVGGLFGIAHYGNKFVNCSSSGNVEITDAAEAGDAEEMGGLAGVWNNGGSDVVFTDCSFTGTLKANITEGLDLSNNLITGAAYNETGTGRLFIDGFQVVNTTELLAAVVNNATEDVKVALGGNMKGDVIFKQKADVDVIVDGRNFKYEGTIYLHGASRFQGAETLTIQNVNFVAEAACDFISCNTTASTERYAHNVTVKNCTFKGVASADVVGMRYRQCYNMKVVNCTATDMHSLMWATGGNGIEIDGVTVENSQNGVSFGTSNGCVVKNSNFASYADYGYGIRVDASGAYTLQVSNCTLTADVPVLLRKATGAYSLTLDDQNTLTATGNYQMILTSSDYESGVELTPATGAITMSGTTGLTIYQ